jgi:preprotein translocase subunit SecG
MRRSRRGTGFHQELGGSGEDSFVAVVVTKLTGALLFILLLTMVIMALVPKADQAMTQTEAESANPPELVLELPENLPEAVVGRPYQYTFSVRGSSTAKLQWSISEKLPEGILLNTDQGSVYGQIAKASGNELFLTVQVSDGSRVASGQTRLPVWNPEQSLASTSQLISTSRAQLSMQSWISNGFGLALIWLGHLSGLGVIDRLESGNQTVGAITHQKKLGRFKGYRAIVWLTSIICTGLVIATINLS